MGTIQLDTKEIVEHMQEDYRASMVSGDVKGLVERFYAKDARVQPNHMPEAVGREAITKTYQVMAEQFGVKAMETSITGFESVGDVTWVTGAYELDFQPEGAPPQHDAGKFVEIYRRQSDGSLRCVVDCFNSDLPLPE